uniref:Uncharacterized protein n=1 Tax=Globodera rostochiensis TaxID=31243 RepID=A0A914I456_GLORO
MDRQLLNLVKNARLGTDQEIGVFLEAVSLSLQRLEPNLLDFPLAEEVENDPPTDDQNENEAVNFPGDSAFIDHDYWPSFLEDQNI